MPRLLRILAAFGLIAGVVVAVAAPAAAHAELTSSSPAQGATVAGPVEHITLEFMAPVVALEDQFALVDGAGQPVAIASIEPDGEATTLHVAPADPLSGDTYGLKWAARAGDTHPRDGTVTFTVEATAASPSITSSDGAAATSDGSGSSEHPAGHVASAGVQDALAGQSTTGPSTLASVVRFLMYGGLLLAIGGILYLALVHRGTRAEGRRLVFLVRRAAVVTLVATIVELPFQAILIGGGSTDAILDPTAYSDLLGGSFGVGVLLKLLGAALVLGGMRMQLDRLNAPVGLRVSGGADDAPTLEHPVVAARGVATRAHAPARPSRTHYTHRVRVESSPVAMLGVAALVGSELFIGHTASTEPRWLVITAAALHLLAAGLWVAGVAMLAATLWRRHRQGAELEAALLATRFSVAAIGAVVGVSITGLALGITILGDLGGFVSTEFGWLLLVKVGLVAVLVALGGYNQKVVIPSLERRRTSRRAGHRLRWLVTAEVVTFLAVLAVTAALVGADSTG